MEYIKLELIGALFVSSFLEDKMHEDLRRLVGEAKEERSEDLFETQYELWEQFDRPEFVICRG